MNVKEWWFWYTLCVFPVLMLISIGSVSYLAGYYLTIEQLYFRADHLILVIGALVGVPAYHQFRLALGIAKQRFDWGS